MGRTWAKLHHCWLGDDQIESLSLEDQARWVRFFLYVDIHGDRGRLPLGGGRWRAARVPLGCRYASAPVLLGILARLPGVVVATDPLTGEPTEAVFKNWHKYQIDDSASRVRRWRASNGQSPVTGNDDPPVTGNGARSRSRSRLESPPTPRVTLPTPDCGHSGADITKLDCSDRHFAARRAYLAAHPPQQTPDTTP